jgi:prepilin-type N-terminal cleavage/methylation domain-containing protein/prepilin-type processing-associated H-X9-DG protein
VKKPRAFTLIELLVVIAIIALLLSILAPALKAVKKRAQGVVCRSNLKQVALAAILYAENWKNYVPRGADSSDEDTLWFIAFLPYLGHDRLPTLVDDDDNPDNDISDYRNVKIYRCPLYPDKRQTICYVINGWDTIVEDDGILPINILEIKRPSRMIYLADNEYGPWRAIIEDEDDPDLSRQDVFHKDHLPDSEEEDDDTYGRRVARDRHRDGCNVLYFDWRAEYIAAEDMTEQMWH